MKRQKGHRSRMAACSYLSSLPQREREREQRREDEGKEGRRAVKAEPVPPACLGGGGRNERGQVPAFPSCKMTPVRLGHVTAATS